MRARARTFRLASYTLLLPYSYDNNGRGRRSVWLRGGRTRGKTFVTNASPPLGHRQRTLTEPRGSNCEFRRRIRHTATVAAFRRGTVPGGISPRAVVRPIYGQKLVPWSEAREGLREGRMRHVRPGWRLTRVENVRIRDLSYRAYKSSSSSARVITISRCGHARACVQ